jgi:hypothetical protein
MSSRLLRTTLTLVTSVSLAPIILTAGSRQASALCQVGTKSSCSTSDGKPGIKICVDEGFGPCVAVPQCTASSASGQVTPFYYVLAVLYAPPGTAAANNKSSNVVSYGDGSNVGTKTTITSDIKSGYTISFGGGAGASGNGGNFGSTTDSSDASAADVEQNTSLTLTDPGPSSDGLNHDNDIIWLWLSPAISLAATTTTSCENKLVWSFGQSTGIAQYVYVAWLKNPSTMPANVAQVLASHKITGSEYSKLLSYDPLANGGTPPSPRYTDTYFNLPFEPPAPGNTSTPAVTIEIDNSDTVSDTTTVSTTDTVGESLSLSAALPLITASPSDSLTWTTQTANSQGATNKAILTLAGPSSAYTATTDPISFEVYKDNLYNTYAFVPIPTTTIATLTGATGQAVAGQLVAATGPSGVTYHTVTNAQGEYKFFGSKPTDVKVVSGRTGPIGGHIGTIERK